MFMVGVISFAFILADKPQQTDIPSSHQVRQAIVRSLPFVEQEGIVWIEHRKCVSCHQVAFLIWSHREAQRVGIPVDDGKLAKWTDWSLNHVLSKGEDDAIVGTKNIEGLSQLLLGSSRR